MTTARWLALAVWLPLVSCAAILGFEDHELLPEGEGGIGGVGGAGGVPSGGSGGSGGSAGAGAGVEVLLIPNRSDDSIGIYDVMTGTYLGDFVPPQTGNEPYEMQSANIAAQGPDGRIYVADQLADAIFLFAGDGSYTGVFADGGDGLNNVRGIDFRNDEVFACVSPTSSTAFVAHFDALGMPLTNFVEDATSAFDILFLDNGTMLLANTNDPDTVRLYDVNGGAGADVLTINFPQQLQMLTETTFVVAAWSELAEAQLDGTLLRSITIDQGRGVHPLGNGFWLLSSNDGVQVIDPIAQSVVQTMRVGGGFSKIERAVLPSLP